MQSNQAKGFFVTATDTCVGKTMATRLLITQLQQAGFSTIGCKPVACGVDENGNNEDVLIYESINSLSLSREVINPVCFDLPASPNIAAQFAGQEISLPVLVTKLQQLRSLPVDYVFYEGVGGWKVPINKNETMIDLVRGLMLPIIFVVGIRVGCLNHALLTWDAIHKEEIPVAGWISNIIDPTTPTISEHIATLTKWIEAPYLGNIPFQNSFSKAENFFNINLLVNDVNKT